MIAWRTVSEMTYNVSSGTLNPTHSLTVVLVGRHSYVNNSELYVLMLSRFNQYAGWPMMPGRMMSQRGGPRGRMPPHAGRGGYYGGTCRVHQTLPVLTDCSSRTILSIL